MPPSEEIKETITAFLQERFHPGVTTLRIDDEASLTEQGLVQSIDFIEIVLFLEKRFGIRVEPYEIGEENFGSLNALCQYVAAKAA